MNSSNFAFILNDCPEVVELCTKAEQYIYSDPSGALNKFRSVLEFVVHRLCEENNILIEQREPLYDLIESLKEKNVVSLQIWYVMTFVRNKGNNGSHNKKVTVNDALAVHNSVFKLVSYLYVEVFNGDKATLPKYVAPKAMQKDENNLKAEIEKLSNENNEKEKELMQTQAELLKLESEKKSLEEQKKLIEQNVNEIQSVSSQKENELSENNKKLKAIIEEKIAALESAQAELNDIKEKLKLVQDIHQGVQVTEIPDSCFSLELADSYNDNLTSSQQELVRRLNDFFKTDNNNVFLLTGYAGTGKTFITQGIAEFLRATGRNLVIAASTGKAARVITDKAHLNSFTIHKTIYSTHFDKQKIGDEDEFLVMHADLRKNTDPKDCVYIVDEASMISDVFSSQNDTLQFGSGRLLKDLLEYTDVCSNDNHRKLIFIGDNYQLPPIKMDFSPALNEYYLRQNYNCKVTGFELVDIVRQKEDSAIIKNAIELRNDMVNKTFNQLKLVDMTPQVREIDKNDFLQEYLNSCEKRISNKSMIIASKNSQVYEYNNLVRNYFFPNMRSAQKGDKIISVSNHYLEDIIIFNGDLGAISEILGSTVTHHVTLRHKDKTTKELILTPIDLNFLKVRVGFRNDEGQPYFFESYIIENLLYSDLGSLNPDEEKALYVDFCMRHPKLNHKSDDFSTALAKDPFYNALKVKFGYAITCHKAQGSEWDNIFVDCNSYHQKKLCLDYYRWLYTAITRASNTLYHLNTPHLGLFSNIRIDTNNFIDDDFLEENTVGITNDYNNSNDDPISIDTPSNMQSSAQNVVPKEMPKNIEANGQPQNNSDSENDNSLDELAQRLGLRPSSSIVYLLFLKVKHALTGLCIDIVERRQHDWCECYCFKYGEEFCSFTFNYNGKHKISRVSTNDNNNLANTLLERLTPLEGILLEKPKVLNSADIFVEDFLIEFNDQLTELLKSHAITITNIKSESYCIKYFVEKNNETAAFLVGYDGKKVFKRFEKLTNVKSSIALLKEVKTIFENAKLMG